MIFEFCVPCLFGLEGLVGDELRRLRMQEVLVQNGQVFFKGELPELIRANLWLRCGERVLIAMARFPARSFDDLFEGVKQISWADFLPQDAAFPVKGYSVDSLLHSVPDCQRIIKKAIVERMKQQYGTEWFEETGARYQVQFAIRNNQVVIYLDTSGPGLHKRGYRPIANAAPLRETLAAAVVKLSKHRFYEPFVDPFCGSGTIVIEAAMLSRNLAPGLYRSFAAETWPMLDASRWDAERERAREAVRPAGEIIEGSDISGDCITLSEENARRAGVSDCVRFSRLDALKRDYGIYERGVLAANPPYGERLLDLKQAEQIYQALGERLNGCPLRQYILTSHERFETLFGRPADKKRKLYNGMIRCDLYQYFR